MDVVLYTLPAIGLLILAAAIAGNHWRSRQDPAYELTPNCLLTRKPLLFVTGARSVFYFKNYWNIYPSYLAEHGYEVYTLRLPWRSRKPRHKALVRALSAAAEKNQSYHVILDCWTLEDLNDLDPQIKKTLLSVNILTGQGPVETFESDLLKPLPIIEADAGSTLQSWLYKAHKSLLKTNAVPTLATLGGTEEVQLKNARLLLERAQILAEMDHLELS